MKRVLFVLFLIVCSIAVSAQNPWHGFFKPVDKANLALSPLTGDANQWLFRFSVGVTGTETVYNKVDKRLEQWGLIKSGAGLSFARYKLMPDGSLYNDISINGFVLTPVTENDTYISIAVTVGAWEIVQAGLNVTPAYFKEGAEYFPVSLLFGLQYKF